MTFAADERYAAEARRIAAVIREETATDLAVAELESVARLQSNRPRVQV